MNTEKNTRRRGKTKADNGGLPTEQQKPKGIVWGRRFAEVMADAGIIVPDGLNKHSIHIYGDKTLADSDLMIGLDVASNYMVVMSSEGKILKQGVYPIADHASPAGPAAEAKD